MGHERVGRLPRTRRWVAVVETMKAASEDEAAVFDVAHSTLNNVRDRLKRIERDPGVRAAFRYLIALSHAGQDDREGPAVPDLSANPSPARLALSLSEFVDAARGSHEYAELAKQAAGDTIARWSAPETTQRDLFPDQLTLEQRWRQAGNGSGFSEVAREFFARFTERYLRYFLDREASASLNTLVEREEFSSQLTTSVDTVAQHAFETSKITQSFSAGWYNRYATEQVPSDRQISSFLRLAFQKIREELARESESE